MKKLIFFNIILLFATLSWASEACDFFKDLSGDYASVPSKGEYYDFSWYQTNKYFEKEKLYHILSFTNVSYSPTKKDIILNNGNDILVHAGLFNIAFYEPKFDKFFFMDNILFNGGEVYISDFYTNNKISFKKIGRDENSFFTLRKKGNNAVSFENYEYKRWIYRYFPSTKNTCVESFTLKKIDDAIPFQAFKNLLKEQYFAIIRTLRLDLANNTKTLENVESNFNFIEKLNGEWRYSIYENGKLKQESNTLFLNQFGVLAANVFPAENLSENSISYKFQFVSYVVYDYPCLDLSLSVNDIVITKENGIFKKEIYLKKFSAKPFLTDKERTIYWYKGIPVYFNKDGKRKPFMKWEISDDFTEIKEYLKDGENWVLQAVMKKSALPSTEE